MPITIVSWLSETRLPRACAGATSAIYIGDRLDARPMAAPPAMRHSTNTPNDPASPVATEDTAKSSADRINSRFRPKRSLSAPESSAPSRQPSSALLLAQPTCKADVR